MLNVSRILIITMSLMSFNAYADPSNVVYNNGPVAGGDSGAGVAMERLRATERELAQTTKERDMAVTEARFRIDRDNSRWSPVVWTIIGTALGGAGTYMLMRK